MKHFGMFAVILVVWLGSHNIVLSAEQSTVSANVPKGTIIAWLPSDEDWISATEVKVPAGWNLLRRRFPEADGTKTREFYLLGSRVNKKKVGDFSGSGRHEHDAFIKGSTSGRVQVKGEPDTQEVNHGTHDHGWVTTGKADSNPRSLQVLWLIKK